MPQTKKQNLSSLSQKMPVHQVSLLHTYTYLEDKMLNLIDERGLKLSEQDQLLFAEQGTDNVRIKLINKLGLSLCSNAFVVLYTAPSSAVREALALLLKPDISKELEFGDLSWFLQHGSKEEKMFILEKYATKFDNWLCMQCAEDLDEDINLKIIDVMANKPLRYTRTAQKILSAKKSPRIFQKMIEKLQKNLADEAMINIAFLKHTPENEDLKIKMMEIFGDKLDSVVQLAICKGASRNTLVQMIAMLGEENLSFEATLFYQKYFNDDNFLMLVNALPKDKITPDMQCVLTNLCKTDELYLKLIEKCGDTLSESAQRCIYRYGSDKTVQKLIETMGDKLSKYLR